MKGITASFVHFTIEIQYEKQNEEPETEVITGQANMNDDHKVERLEIRDNKKSVI